MKAVRLYDYTGLDGLGVEDMETPRPGSGQVLVEVKATAVNPVDWKLAEGALKDVFGHTLPLTLGCEISGVVRERGEDSSRFAAGDEVFGFVSLVACGGFAELVAAPESELAPKPAGLSHVQAAALPVGALTSWQALFEMAGLGEGQRVLIHAASGGVGSLAVQLARARGVQVVATASARNEEFVRSLGADEFIDYRSQRFEDGAGKPNVVFDTIGGQTQERSFSVLPSGGFLVSIVSPPSEELAAKHGVRAGMTMVRPDGGRLEEIARLADAGQLRPEVAETLSLDQAKTALATSREGHTRGKLVLIP